MISFFFLSPLIAIHLLLLGFSDIFAAASKNDPYLPGRLIVKLESHSGDPKNLQTGDIQNIHANALQLLESAMEPYDIRSISPVLGPHTLSKLKDLKWSRPQISDKVTGVAASLLNTWTITYRSADDPAQVAAEIENQNGVVYAEPHFIYYTADTHLPEMYPDKDTRFSTVTVDTVTEYIPNDPMINRDSPNFFEYQNIFKAWGVTTGSPDVVIAIVDTGVFYDHPDLRDNLWFNQNPGLANDFFEDFEIVNDTIGWNFWESGDIYKGEDPVQNANPVGNYNTHGTRVAGAAAAVTDNAEGVAATGFNSRFMPVKVGGTKEYPNSMPFAIHGIIYAAINGADVINCSFIGTGNSNFARDAIDFAMEMGSVVVAAMGNNGASTTSVYPASFDDVLAVGAVTHDYNDRLTHFTNYGYKVDVFAVGQSIMSTRFEFDDSFNTWTPDYQTFTGTSASAPVVSGLAALIKAKNPDWPAQRIVSQIRNTARSIRHANPGAQYEDKLGHGLIDAYAALTENVPVISFTEHKFSNEQNQKINTGETGTLTVEGIHFGGPSPDFHFNLESLQPGITILEVYQELSNLDPGETFSMQFTLQIDADYPLDTPPRFRLNWFAGELDDPSYQGVHIMEYNELLFGNMNNDRLTMSIPSDGTLGFMNPSDKSIGYGFIPQRNDNILSEAGIMISGYRNDELAVINQVRVKDSLDAAQQKVPIIERHFQPVQNFRFHHNHDIRNAQVGTARFNTTNHPFAKELEIELESIALVGRTNSRPSLYLNLHVTNNSNHIYRDLHFGIFNFWKLREEGAHQIQFSEDQNLLYVTHESGSIVAGIASRGNVSGALAIDNHSTMTLDRAESRTDSLRFGILYQEDNELLDGFTDMEKYLALTSGTERTSVTAEDVSMVIGTGPYTLYPNSKITVGFIYAWELSPQRLINEVSSALRLGFLTHDEPGAYAETGRVADEFTLYANYPNPFNNQTNIRFDLSESKHVNLVVYDLIGRRVAVLVDEVRDQGPHFVQFNGRDLASGTYIAILRANGQIKSDMMMMVK